MKTLSNEELKLVNGGTISGTLISSIVRGATLLFDLGRTLGSAFVRIINRSLCR